MLRGLEVVKTDDIAQALNQTIQLQPLGRLLGIQPCLSHLSPLSAGQRGRTSGFELAPLCSARAKNVVVMRGIATINTSGG
jgi:hypothetical protein